MDTDAIVFWLVMVLAMISLLPGVVGG